MPTILVVEQELDTAHRIRDLLTASGKKVRIASGPGQAFEASAAEAPDLVLVSSEVAGAGSIAARFARRSGGPGVIALLAPTPLARFFAAEGDDQVTKPFGDQDLLQAVERALASRPAPAATATRKLTSQDIFGDVLAEVESAMPTLPTPPRAQPPRPPVQATQPISSVSPAPPRASLAQSADDEMKRKLEKTLSGVLGPEFLSRPTPAPARKPELPPDDVDALISKTLSNLDMGARPRPAAAPASPGAPAPPPAAAAPPRPAAPPPQAPSPRTPTKTDLDLAQLADLARTGRRTEPAPPAPPAASSRPATQTGTPPPRVAPPPATAAAVPPPAASPAPPPPMATQRIEMSGLLFEEDGEGGEHFGQYRLLEKIAVGGMAELWKARMRGVQGFQKTVAIKKILPHMTDNADFVEMFIDEAKLAAQLNHPNIVHIYDLGKIGRDYYIAMEYVEGKDLRSLLNRAAKNGLSVPAPLALLIAARLASALHYAHRKRDFEGREMGLVHRDVSPQNVLLTLDGDVKLCDFGIAKAVSKASQTQVGALKGKLQYMSPEQAWGKPVDFRSDIFSLGVILFELLTGERLFPGDSEMSILEAVRQNRIRSPRDVVPTIAPQVDEIVSKALATQPEGRYSSAGEMEHHIEAVLHELRMTPGSADLANFIQDVITSQPRDRAPSPTVSPSSPPSPFQTPPPAPPLEAPAAVASPPVRPVAPPPVEAAPVSAPLPAREATVVPIVPLVEPPKEEKRGKGWLLLVLLVAAAALAAAYFLVVKPRLTSSSPPPAPAASAPQAGAPAPPPAAEPPAASAGEGQAIPEEVIQGQVEEALARQQKELEKEFEEKKRQLEREIARNKAAAKNKTPPSADSEDSPPSR